MSKSQIALSLGAVLLVLLLFQLPRVVVENDQLQEVTSEVSHELAIPTDVRARMNELRRLLEEEVNVDKRANFAHSLANYYLDYGVLDSAASLGAAIESWSEEPERKAADIYFKAFQRSQSQEQARGFASKAKEILDRLLDKDPTDLALKNKLAMTLVSSENPMAGIGMLREILEVDENNRLALLNLGLLSIQSTQFDKAKERFEKLVFIDSADHEAKLYLAVSMIEIDEQSQARLLLQEIVSSSDSIPAIKMMALDYLNGL